MTSPETEDQLAYYFDSYTYDNIPWAEKNTYLGNFGDLFALPDPELFSDRGESGAGVYKPLLVIIVK